MNTKTRIICAILILAMTTSGCFTGIVARPDLKRLCYDEQGVLRYDGQKVEGIKLELPWYKEMWPDNLSEWGLTLVTVGATAVLSGGGGGGANTGGETVAVATTTSSSSSSSGSSSGSSSATSTTTSSGGSSGGGSGGGGSATPPASGGGDELPF